MNHDDHIALLRAGVPQSGGVWADVGSGTGAFTLALADLLDPGAQIYSVDRDQGALREQASAVRARFPGVALHPVSADFTRALDLPLLDGIVMANALHFTRDKTPVVRQLGRYLRPGGHFILVEYNVDHGNVWVPHPLSYPTWARLAGEAGLVSTRLLGTVPSRFLSEIYSALSLVPGAESPSAPDHRGRGHKEDPGHA